MYGNITLDSLIIGAKLTVIIMLIGIGYDLYMKYFHDYIDKRIKEEENGIAIKEFNVIYRIIKWLYDKFSST